MSWQHLSEAHWSIACRTVELREEQCVLRHRGYARWVHRSCLSLRLPALEALWGRCVRFAHLQLTSCPTPVMQRSTTQGGHHLLLTSSMEPQSALTSSDLFRR